MPIRLLETQLGHSILQLFKEDDFIKYDLFPNPDSKRYVAELGKIALDEKVKRLIAEFYNDVNKNYDGFTKYGK